MVLRIIKYCLLFVLISFSSCQSNLFDGFEEVSSEITVDKDGRSITENSNLFPTGEEMKNSAVVANAMNLA